MPTFVLDEPESGQPFAPSLSSAVAARPRLFSDAQLVHTVDGGEVTFRDDGDMELGDGLFNAAYISLFGGNRHDSGSTADAPKQWWGNFAERVEARKLRSETQALLLGIPAIPANLVRIEDAVLRDLAWMSSIADDISAACSIPALNRIAIEIRLVIGDEVYRIPFDQPWGARTQ